MSKTFKSAEPDNRELEVDVLIGSPRLLIKDFDGDNKGFIFGKADAPALALAILEAAGYTEDDRDDSGLTHFAIAMLNLRMGIENQERVTAEAEAQAKLEAEALELYNAWREANDYDALSSFSDGAPIGAMAEWLAVARRAREMAKETPNDRP